MNEKLGSGCHYSWIKCMLYCIERDKLCLAPIWYFTFSTIHDVKHTLCHSICLSYLTCKALKVGPWSQFFPPHWFLHWFDLSLWPFLSLPFSFSVCTGLKIQLLVRFFNMASSSFLLVDLFSPWPFPSEVKSQFSVGFNFGTMFIPHSPLEFILISFFF